jgi:predicted aminopeptidase
LNNAQLSTVSTYNDLVPVFDKLLENVGGDLTEFYDSVIKISNLSEEARSKALEEIE